MQTTSSKLQHGRIRTVAAIGVLAVFGGVGYLFWSGAGPLPDPEGCSVSVGGVEVRLDTEQAENATTIAAVAVRRGLPARAISIAIATAFQESKLINVSHGDRDSLGLFQQRPSQGWGTEEQIMDPYYSANKFFDALVNVDGYEEMRITEAAQEVQRSAFPEAYEDHAEGARALASALTGYSPRAHLSCVVDESDQDEQDLEETGLTGRADAVRRELAQAFGDLSLGGFAPGGVSTGHMEGSAHYEGRALDIFVRPISPENKRTGWTIAQYLVAHAERLGIAHVIFDDRIWTVGRSSEEGWRNYDPPERTGDRAILEHRDHVHVDVG
ncbi:MAG TPA: hypothetical protein VLI04_07400 [Nocardioidaceae bacterium]|nr:hypothetical protein [Nocardioidaceae bacterium]